MGIELLAAYFPELQNTVEFMNFSTENFIFVWVLVATTTILCAITFYIIYFIPAFFLGKMFRKKTGINYSADLHNFKKAFPRWDENKYKKFYNFRLPEDAPIRILVKNPRTVENAEKLVRVIALISEKIESFIVFSIFKCRIICFKISELLSKLIFPIFLTVCIGYASTLFCLNRYITNLPHPNYWKYEIFGDQKFDENWLDT